MKKWIRCESAHTWFAPEKDAAKSDAAENDAGKTTSTTTAHTSTLTVTTGNEGEGQPSLFKGTRRREAGTEILASAVPKIEPGTLRADSEFFIKTNMCTTFRSDTDENFEGAKA